MTAIGCATVAAMVEVSLRGFRRRFDDSGRAPASKGVLSTLEISSDIGYQHLAHSCIRKPISRRHVVLDRLIISKLRVSAKENLTVDSIALPEAGQTRLSLPGASIFLLFRELLAG